MPAYSDYTIFPLGDSALTIDFGNCINEDINGQVISLFHYINKYPVPGIIESVPAYSSLTVYYDFMKVRKSPDDGLTVFEKMKAQLENILQAGFEKTNFTGRLMKIPVCYHPDFGIDIEKVVNTKKISVEELINIHSRVEYKVYMLGFLPGFAYMGLADELISTTRKIKPENTMAGSVGIAGRQTGIYPIDSPGGWQIIGRTPLRMFNSTNPAQQDTKDFENSGCLLQAGDRVQFYSITKDEFEDIKTRST